MESQGELDDVYVLGAISECFSVIHTASVESKDKEPHMVGRPGSVRVQMSSLCSCHYGGTLTNLQNLLIFPGFVSPFCQFKI